MKAKKEKSELKFMGHSVTDGITEGEALVTTQSFGFLGSIDPLTGRIIDEKHALCGQIITDKILIFPNSIGSTMGAIYLLDAVRCKNGPAAMVNVETEPILAAGAIMSEIFYNKKIPVVDRVSDKFFKRVRSGNRVKVNGNTGTVEIILEKSNLQSER
jgi:predicted aconitase with swiveling domain